MAYMKRSILSASLSFLFIGLPFITPLCHATEIQSQKVYVASVGVTKFPIDRAIYFWNRNPNSIQLIKVDSCESFDPCLNFTQHYAPTIATAGGRFWVSFTEVEKWYHSDLFYWSGFTYRERRMVVCHELGHFLRVEHNKYGCMRDYIRPDSHTIDPQIYPTWRNLERVRFPA